MIADLRRYQLSAFVVFVQENLAKGDVCAKMINDKYTMIGLTKGQWHRGRVATAHSIFNKNVRRLVFFFFFCQRSTSYLHLFIIVEFFDGL